MRIHDWRSLICINYAAGRSGQGSTILPGFYTNIIATCKKVFSFFLSPGLSPTGSMEYCSLKEANKKFDGIAQLG